MNADPLSDFRTLAAGVRMFASSITLIFAYINVRFAFQAGWFHEFFTDALPGKKLPDLSIFVVQFRSLPFSGQYL